MTSAGQHEKSVARQAGGAFRRHTPGGAGKFAQEGYAAARMENIAARAGVTKGLIYFYYKNKQALFEAMFSECIREPLRGNLLDTDPARSMASHLARGLFNIYHNLMDAPFFGQLARLILLEGHRFPEIHAYYYREVLTPIMDILRGFLDEGVRRGEWKAEVVPEFLHILLAPGILFALWRLSLGQYKFGSGTVLPRTPAFPASFVGIG